jgi:hypothetical protein
VLARLQHPNVVQIFEVGECEGRPFLAMEFCSGGSLEKKLNGTPLPAREAARLIESLASAVEAAHQAHVLHRDLKPGNVLLDANGTPKVTDFGLAKKLDQQGHTQSGAILGTAAYMAPEQATGRIKQVGPAADVYALGVILYEALTGRPPFRGDNLLETLEQVRSQNPVPPRRLAPGVPADLETICLKCLQKDIAARYASAGELAADLRRFLDGQPVQARSPRWWQGPLRLARRHRLAAVAGLGGCVVALLAVFLGARPRPQEALPSPGKVRSSRGGGEGKPPLPRGPKGTQHALLIGVREYEDRKFAGLKFTENDVEALAKVLRSPDSSFASVRLLTTTRGKDRPADRPTAANIRTALKKLLADRDKDDLVLVALAGHGVRLWGKAVRKDRTFFCPADARLEEPKTLLNMNELFSDMEKSGAGVRLLLADACRNDLAGSRDLDVDDDPKRARGSAALFSCAPGQRSFESPKLGPRGHGVFFHFVLEALRGKALNQDNEVTWDGLVSYVRRQVPPAVSRIVGGGARQTPHLVANLAGESPALVRPGRPTILQGLRKEAGRLADEIKEWVVWKGKDSIDVREFTGPPRHFPDGRLTVRKVLVEELKARGVAAQAGADLSVKGSYLVVGQASEESARFRLRLIHVVEDNNAPRTPPPDTLRKELGKYAEEIKKLLAGQGKDSIDIGEFTGPATPITSAGPGIQQILIEELKARKVTVKSGAELYIKGEYLVDDDSDKTRDRIVLRLLSVVRDKRGKTLLNWDTDIKSNLDIIKIIAHTARPPRDEPEPFRKELGKFAEDIKKLVLDHSKGSIDVGEFTGPAKLAPGAGGKIRSLIIQELKARRIRVESGAELYIKGQFQIVADKSDKTRDQAILRLATVVFDKRGRPLLNMDADIKTSLTTLARHLEINLDPPARLKTHKDSPYSVEVRVRKDVHAKAVARKPSTKKRGSPFIITISKGEYYELFIENKSDYDAAVSVTIDGLDMFTFSELRNPRTRRPLYTHWIIPKGKSLTIIGWHKNNKKSNLFEVAGIGDSEAAKLLKSTAKVGTITVCFHAAWEGDNTPPDEKGARSLDDLGTKRGLEVGKVMPAVKRKIGVLREAITVRYGKGSGEARGTKRSAKPPN